MKLYESTWAREYMFIYLKFLLLMQSGTNDRQARELKTKAGAPIRKDVQMFGLALDVRTAPDIVYFI